MNNQALSTLLITLKTKIIQTIFLSSKRTPKTPSFYDQGTPKITQRSHTDLELSGDRILIHVNVVLVKGSHDELVTLRLHPSGHKRGQVEPWCTIQHQLIVYYLISCILWYAVPWHLEPSLNISTTNPSTTEIPHFTKKHKIV